MSPRKIAEQLEIDAKYAVYLDRQTADIESYRRDESFELPDELDYAALPGLSHEIRQKLAALRPRTIGQAGRIDGMTPAALTLLVAHVRRQPRADPPPEARLIQCPKPEKRRSQPRAGRPSSAALSSTPVSRETAARLDRFVELLLPVAAHTNLIAPSTIPQIWTRHVADLLQLLPSRPTQKSGSISARAAAFPGW